MSNKQEIHLSPLHSWEFKKFPHAIVSGRTGSGKSYCVYNILYGMTQHTANRNIYVLDFKFHELKHIAISRFNIPNVATNLDEAVCFIKEVEKIMISRQNFEDKEHEVIFIILEEFSALKTRLDRNQFNEIQMSVLHMVNLGRALNVQVVLSIQRPSSQLMSTDIREQFGIVIGMGEIKGDTYKMLFGQSKLDYELKSKEIGEGYIQIGGGNVENYKTPIIKGL